MMIIHIQVILVLVAEAMVVVLEIRRKIWQVEQVEQGQVPMEAQELQGKHKHMHQRLQSAVEQVAKTDYK
jgi:hypothetical protein